MYTAAVFVAMVVACSAHMRVTFPAARNYDFDWLDDVETQLPCGMRREAIFPVTKFQKGQDVVVTWHQSIIHEGGVKIQLLDNNGNVLYNLTKSDEDDYLYRNDTRIESHTVSLPADYVCDDCILRVRREVSIPEIQLKRDYLSCADIVIEESLPCPSDCSGHGACVNGTCVCNRLYVGDACQYRDECEDDTDCGVHGRCIDSQGTFYPKKKCFCEEGFFGLDCNLENPSDFIIDVTSDVYNHIQLNENTDMHMYWRILEESSEIEIVVQANTNNWITLGWKPADITIECSTFPVPRSGYPDQPETGELIRPMYCADMVVGMAIGNLGRVRDLYSRDQSTPQEDAWFGGTDGITASTATDFDGVTTVAFRRLLTSTERSDHNITDSDMMLVWARGRQQDDFYQHDEFKGHELFNSDYRGSTVLNFFDNDDDEEDGCYNEFRYPSDCDTDDDCSYHAKWTVDSENEEVHFEIVAVDSQDRWVGIGFSEDTLMTNSDAIVGWVTAEGVVEITDRWMPGYVVPPLDAEDNVYNKAGRHVDGKTTLSFSRKIVTTDTSRDLSLICPYLLFPIRGGTYDAVSKSIGIHRQFPLVSTGTVCFQACESPTEVSVTAEASTTADALMNTCSVGTLSLAVAVYSFLSRHWLSQ